jgi:CO dehydrogenase/acetyl-CoA synthase epsilon subunit
MQNKIIILKNGHTMYVSSYSNIVNRIVKFCNEKQMPVHSTTLKMNADFDLSFEVENYCSIKFKNLMQHERYESSTTANGNKTTININFY